MIEINLLPEAMRKKKMALSDLGIEMDKVRILIGAGAIGFLILLLIFLALGSFIRNKQIQGLMAKEEAIREQKSRVEALDKEISGLKVKMSLLNQITKREFLWAKKLNEFSDLVLPGIWFRRIYTDSNEEDCLIVDGSVISKREKAMAIVGKFMNELRISEEFFKDFSSMKLESVQRKTMEERDVVDFRLVLTLISTN